MIIFAVERMRDCLEEIRPLHHAHWDELPALRPQAEFKPDYERYLRLEEQGATVLATARREGRLVGYSMWYINRDLWTSEPYASGNLLYVVPAERGRWIGVRLFGYAHDAIASTGVREFRSSSRDGNAIRSLLRYFGYQPGAREYVRLT